MTTFERELTDTAVWFHANKDRIPDLHKRCEFLTKAVDQCLLLLAEAGHEFQRLRGHQPDLPALLWTPNGLTSRSGE